MVRISKFEKTMTLHAADEVYTYNSSNFTPRNRKERRILEKKKRLKAKHADSSTGMSEV